jgi:hypothetical protein
MFRNVGMSCVKRGESKQGASAVGFIILDSIVRDGREYQAVALPHQKSNRKDPMPHFEK